MVCPARSQIADSLNGKLDEPVSRVVFAHLDICEQCRQVADNLEGVDDSFISDLRASSAPTDANQSCVHMIERAESLAVGEGNADFLDAINHTPQQIRDYQILEPLGFGGMGEVYRARHVRLKRDAAIKLFSKHRTNNDVALRFFQHEIEAVGRLEQHPHLVQALDAGEHDGIQYLVMQLVDGQYAEQLVRDKEFLNVADVCEIGRQAAIGLHYAHQQGLIHRDVKPTNLMISAGGAVQVMDLGLSMFRAAEGAMKQVVGTVQYMAPEQAEWDAEVDLRTDIYGLGGTLYYLLTGKAPHQSEHKTQKRNVKHRVRKPTASILAELTQIRKDVPPELRSLLEQMSAPAAQDRPDSMAQVAKQLSQFCDGADLFQMMADYRAGAECGEALVADVAHLHASEVDAPTTDWTKFKVGVFSIIAIVGFLLSAAVWQAMFPVKPTHLASDDVNVTSSMADDIDSAAMQLIEPARTDFQFRLVTDDNEYLITNSPGYTMSVTALSSSVGTNKASTEVLTAWDPLEFKMKYPSEFVLYERGWQLAEPLFDQVFPYSNSDLADEIRYLRKVEFGKSERRVSIREPKRSIYLTESANGRIRISISSSGGRSDSDFASPTAMESQSKELFELYQRYHAPE